MPESATPVLAGLIREMLEDQGLWLEGDGLRGLEVRVGRIDLLQLAQSILDLRRVGRA